MSFKEKFLQVAICDDEKSFCIEVEDKLSKISRQLNISMEISVWFSGEALKDYLGRGNSIDIIFLDIELMRLTGIDIGNYIRTELNNIKIQIVYVSSKTNYALKLFKTQPYDFLIKPINEETLLKTIEGILKIIETKNQMFEYQNGRNTYKIEYDHILYFKSEAHKIVIVSIDQEITFYGKLKEIANTVPSQFIIIHKSFLINRDYVVRYAFNFVEMKNGDILTISKVYRKIVREQLSYKRNSFL